MEPTLTPVGDGRDFTWLVSQFLEIISLLVVVVFAFAFVFLLWQIISGFVLNGGDTSKTSEAKKSIGFSFLVLIVMAAVWGIVAILRTSIIP